MTSFMSIFSLAFIVCYLKNDFPRAAAIFTPKITLTITIAYIVCLRFLLLLAGDVAENPGPPSPGNQNSQLKFGHWNLNSLLANNKSKITLIEALQASANFDLFGVSESFLNEKTAKEDLEIHGFSKNPIRADSPSAS